MVVGVLVQLSSQSVDKVFDYFVPSHLIGSIKVGIRVLVPFGKQTLEGFVLQIKDESDRDLKEIYSVLDQDVILNPELLLLGQEIQRTTLSTLISTYQVMLPKALKAKAGVVVPKKYQTFYQLQDKNYMPTSSAQKKLLDLFSERKFILRQELFKISR